MKIGTRVTLLTVLLVVLTLSLYGLLSVRARRAELTDDLERQTQLLGSSLRVALEAALQDGLFEDVRQLVDRMQKTDQPIKVVYLDLVHPDDSAAFAKGKDTSQATQKDAPAYQPPPADPTRDGRQRRVQISGLPYGEHIEAPGRPVYAYMVPLRDSQRRVVALLDLIRDAGDAQQALLRSQQGVAVSVTLLSILLAVLLGLTVQKAFSGPLLRLVGGIDEVTRGDYTGAILREGEDEVGLLADRFNEMTRSLRQAREEILAGVDAKLQLEMRLRHSDKLATIGQLAAGIAHEVGTPLNVIGGRARAMARRGDDPAAVQKNAEIIAAQAERITKIIQQLLDYARRKAPAKAKVDLQRVAVTTLDFLEHQLTTGGVSAVLRPFTVAAPGPLPTRRSGKAAGGGPVPGASGERTVPREATGEVALPPPTVPVVIGDADQLQQVCLNLCMNAMQAMHGGGSLEIALWGLCRRKPGLDRSPPGAYVMLSVSDTGVGIPEADRERIFEPFYSTKLGSLDSLRSDGGRAGGSGLGLAVSAGIVKDHDGWIEIEPRARLEEGGDGNQGGGTTFRIFLPAPDPYEEEWNEHGAAFPNPEPGHAAQKLGVPSGQDLGS